ncbi:polysaccharide deacetylase family protein [Paenibacillus sp. HN-1]|uniref:polysaccharide deacetylase n=1 Tax=Paenibacillus TaxID=44249 RepID=UPI001CA9C0E6|nr:MULTISPECIES: polysaccharide deacetylase [Paenibacillus]MBY9077471.1 polysaccharide deacetylase family protein [Paenibacillus sp. CGMCC 1.18879]MBY9084752.1 polysaccharide deacetylase family protein [Paenibacillus sinensis]
MFRKFGITALICMMLLGMASSAWAVGSTSLKLGINDSLTDVKATAVDDTFYVPLRAMAEQLKLNLGGTPQDLVLSSNSVSLRITGGSKAISGNGTEMAVTTFVRGGSIMVPVKVATLLGYSVSYKPELYLLRLTDGSQKLDDKAFASKYQDQLKPKAPTLPSAGVTQPKPSTPKPGTPKPTAKTVYLTFDDGPSANTGRLLDILDKHGVKATFFMLGPNIGKYPSQVKRMTASGHGLGLHGMSHVKNKFYASPAAALNEMNQDNAALKKAAGVTTRLIRTPYGSKPYFTGAFRDKVLSDGYHLWDWNIDSLDWKYKSDSASIYRGVVNQLTKLQKSGTAPIILMHDQKTTLNVLPRILDYLQSHGYQFEIITSDLTPVNFWKDVR